MDQEIATSLGSKSSDGMGMATVAIGPPRDLVGHRCAAFSIFAVLYGSVMLCLIRAGPNVGFQFEEGVRMNPGRRELLVSLATTSLGFWASDGRAQEAATLDALVDSAFEYAFPLYEIARARYRAVQDPANPARRAPNTLAHERQLADDRSRRVTTP